MPSFFASLKLLLAAAACAGSVSAHLDAGLSRHAAGAERASWASSLFLGAPYRPSPLGEGFGLDADPRFRLDAFDCVTFVETAIALGNARSTAGAERLLDDIRYRGLPDYQSRNHYVESEWIPSLEEKGWLVPLTGELAGSTALRVVKHLDDAAWKEAARSGHLLPGLRVARCPRGDFALDLLPLSRLREVAPLIPDGTVMLVVREDRPNRPSRVTHMGLVIARKDGSRALRHASDVPGVLRVRDEPIDAFVRRAERQPWKIVGVSLYRVRDNSERAERLAAGEGPPQTFKGEADR